MRTVALLLAFLLAGCDLLPKSNGDNNQSPSAGWGKARIVDDAEVGKIGRFQGLPRFENEEQLILDTATGCTFRTGAVASSDAEGVSSIKCELTNRTPADAQRLREKYGLIGPSIGESK